MRISKYFHIIIPKKSIYIYIFYYTYLSPATVPSQSLVAPIRFIQILFFELVVGWWDQLISQSTSLRKRESIIQIALRGKAFPVEIDASGPDISISPTSIPRAYNTYLFSPSM
jgi:hypothetical protein